MSLWMIGAALVTAISFFLLSNPRPPRSSPSPSSPSSFSLPSVLVPAYTSHVRILPIPAKHAFSYPLIYLGVDIDSLESGSLDLPFRLLKYGGHPLTKWLGLRPDGYLVPGPKSLREKMNELLVSHGVGVEDESMIGRVWLVTMPSFMGFEGINPLSVWYVYDREAKFSACVLEVHNTFGEKHAYVLRMDSQYRHEPKPGHHYAWTFPRTFHVSPFNSRNGYYRLDLLDPFPPATLPSDTDTIPSLQDPEPEQEPRIKISLRLLTPSKKTKLIAILASHPIHPPIPLHPSHIPSMLYAIARWPLALFASTPRILYQAWQLHYDKKLAVFPRPEPRLSGHEGSWNPPQEFDDHIGEPIAFQPTNITEKMAQAIVVRWARARAMESGIELDIRRHGNQPGFHFPVEDDSRPRLCQLTIITSCPTLFTRLLCCPTPDPFIALAPELLTSISDSDLFRRFFTSSTGPPHLGKGLDDLILSMQRRYFLFLCSCSIIAPPPHLVVNYSRHFTCSGVSLLSKLQVLCIIWMAFMRDWVEEMLMGLMKAQWVPGGHPQRIWERALRRQYRANEKLKEHESDEGSKLAVEEDLEGWEDVGSLLY